MSTSARVALATLFTLPLLAGCTGDVSEEETALSSEEIVGGTVENGQPAVASILYDQDNSTYICSGTLISANVVLTAAHCIVPTPPAKKSSNWRVYFGPSVAAAKASDWIPVSQAAAHPGYVPNGFGKGKDAGVLVLSKAVTNVTPIPPNRTALTPAIVGGALTVVGFGNNDGAKGTGAGTKRTGQLRITDVRTEELSAGQPGLTTCQGDSGGPWFAKTANGGATVVGITSYGPIGCTNAGSATRVDKVMDFVAPFLGKGAPPKQPPPNNPPPGNAPTELNAGTTVKGSVTGNETDTFTFTTGSAKITFNGTGDAQIIIRNSNGGQSVASGNVTATMQTYPAAKFTIQVRSPSGAAQSYTLRRD
jgi:secreted trypsin-like serine protease